jgi:ABC-type xylose transport system permease subunit
MPESTPAKATRRFWTVAAVALAWNLVGVMSYLMSVTAGPEVLAALPEAERSLYAEIPAWATSAYAIAVFGGLLGSIALLLRKAWAVPLFVVSLLAVLVQMGHAFFMTALLEVKGPGAAVLPGLVLAIAAYLVWFSRSARERGLLT